MSILSRREIERIAGPLDETLVVDILATGATSEELVEALGWLYADDVMADDLHREPAGRVAVLCEILSRSAIESDDDMRPAPEA